MAGRRWLSVLMLEDRCVPSGIPSTWSQRGSGGGGSLFSPSVNPANLNEYYVASDMSQLFRTTDAGATWQTTDHREIQGNHESRVYFTNDANVRYSLDYTTVAGADLVRPSKSTDAGATWTPLASDPTGGEAYYLFVDPANKNRLAITDYTRLFFSTDGGANWTLKYTGGSGAGLLVGGAFWDGTNIFFGTNSGLLVSTNSGSTFAVASVGGLPSGHVMIGFAGSKAAGVTRFVAVTQAAADSYAGLPGYDNSGGTSVVTLDYGSANWTVRTLPASAWPYYAGMVTGNTGTMYVAGGSSSGVPTVYKSTDGGANWTSTFQTTNNANIQTGWSGHGGDRGWGYGELALGFTVDGTDPANHRLILSDYGFAHSSTDGGANWKALYVDPADRNPANQNTPIGKSYRSSGLDNTTSWGVTWANNNRVFISNSDIRGQLSADGGQSFGFGYTGHGRNSMYRVVKAPNGTLYGAAASVHDMYQSTRLQDSILDAGNGAVLFSINDGATWQTLKDFGKNVVWFAIDPNNANRAFASVVHSTQGGVFVTNDLNLGAGSTWTKLANPPRTEGHPFNVVVLNDGSIVASYSGRRNSSGAFTASSGVFHSTDGGATWADRSHTGMRYWTKDVVIDPYDQYQNTWYAGVFSGWGGAPNGLGGLYKSIDRGATWTRILNLDRVTSASFNPTDANELFVTTETEGLWYSSNIRGTTPTFSQVANYPFRQPERVFFNPNNQYEMWVTSFGGGVRVGLTTPPAPSTSFTVNVGDAQRSRITAVTVQFDSPVNAATLTGVGAITFTRTMATGLGTLGTVVQTGVTGANGRVLVAPAIGMVTSVTLTFDNANGAPVTAGVENGSLADGRWQLAIPGRSFTSTLNDPALRRLFGDVNNDGVVDNQDFVAFGADFNVSFPSGGSRFDSDANGVVDAFDFAAFGNNFNRSL